MIQIQIFTKVALFTTVERYNDDQFINHHGFQRNVKDKDTKSNLKDSNINGLKGIPKVRMAPNNTYLIVLYLSTSFIG